MKISLYILLISCAVSLANAQPKTKFANANKVQIAEASCGQCQFKMQGKGCDLAVRINGKSYFVDGTKIDDHGDAHAKDGFCEKIRIAGIKGIIVNKRFVATYFKLLPETIKNN